MPPITSSRPFSSRGLIVLLLVLGTLAPTATLPHYLRAKNSAQWPQAIGVITSSYLQVGYFKRRKSYLPEIRYRYQVGPTEYSGSRRSFNTVHLATQAASQRVIDAYPVGKTVAVFYDPKDPASALLEPGIAGDLTLLYKMDLFFIAAFGAALLIALYKFREPAIR
jgi:hypothetical protein